MENQNNQQVATPTVYEIVMHAKRIKGEKDGRKYDFMSYEATDTKGQKAKFKFVKELAESGILPKEAGEYLFKIDKRYINRDKKTRFNEYWVREVVSVEPYVPHFDDNVEDLPF